MERIEAIARWAEQLRDTMSAAAGLHEAIGVTARVAPLPIRPEVQELAARLRREPLSQAARHFAARLANPAGDHVAVALILASERHGSRLSEVLGQVAAATRAEASLRLRIEAQRARTYSQARLISAVIGAVVTAYIVLNRSYLAPFRTPIGQVVLAGVCGCGSDHCGRWSGWPSWRPANGYSRRSPRGRAEVMIAVLLGMIAGAGLWLIARGWRPARPSLAASMADLSFAAHPTARGSAGGGTDSFVRRTVRRTTLARVATGRDGRADHRPRPPRTVAGGAGCRQAPDRALRRRPPGRALAGLYLGHPFPAGLVGVAGDRPRHRWLVPRRPAGRGQGQGPPPAVRGCSATYLRLVTVFLAGGSGTEEALQDAAAYGTGWGFSLLRRCVTTPAWPVARRGR